MNGYEKIIKTIRDESNKVGNKSLLKIGIMKGKDKCMLGSLELDKDDLIINSSLKGELKKDDEVLICRISDEIYVIIAKVEAI